MTRPTHLNEAPTAAVAVLIIIFSHDFGMDEADRVMMRVVVLLLVLVVMLVMTTWRGDRQRLVVGAYVHVFLVVMLP